LAFWSTPARASARCSTTSAPPAPPSSTTCSPALQAATRPSWSSSPGRPSCSRTPPAPSPNFRPRSSRSTPPPTQAITLTTPASPPVDTTSNNPNNSNSNGRGYGRDQHAGTVLYDALFLSADELLSKQKGRKALIILSDGDDRGSKESISSSIEAAQRADTVVYAIYFKGRETGNYDNNRNQQGGGYPGGRGGGYPGIGFPGGGGGYPGGGRGGRGGQQPSETPPRTDGKKVLQRMADETGGRLFEVSKKQTVADIYKQIGEELRAQYRLAFTPDQTTASDGYHRIDLSFTKSSPKDLYIQTRDGYYTGN
jgi:VWFA-related protein